MTGTSTRRELLQNATALASAATLRSSPGMFLGALGMWHRAKS